MSLAPKCTHKYLAQIGVNRLPDGTVNIDLMVENGDRLRRLQPHRLTIIDEGTDHIVAWVMPWRTWTGWGPEHGNRKRLLVTIHCDGDPMTTRVSII
jgi:hypothetical protein